MNNAASRRNDFAFSHFDYSLIIFFRATASHQTRKHQTEDKP